MRFARVGLVAPDFLATLTTIPHDDSLPVVELIPAVLPSKPRASASQSILSVVRRGTSRHTRNLTFAHSVSVERQSSTGAYCVEQSNQVFRH